MRRRYVILRHEGVADPHFDLMFEIEVGSSLATWRSPTWPIAQPTRLVKLEDHRRDYLEYEGPVSGDRGTVTRVAAGTYRTGPPLPAQLEVRLSRDNCILIRQLTKPDGQTYWEAVPL